MCNERTKLSDQIRRAIDDSGLTRYRICKTLKIAESTLSRFMTGKGGLSLEVLDALANLLNLDIRTTKRRKPRKEG